MGQPSPCSFDEEGLCSLDARDRQESVEHVPQDRSLHVGTAAESDFSRGGLEGHDIISWFVTSDQAAIHAFTSEEPAIFSAKGVEAVKERGFPVAQGGRQGPDNAGATNTTGQGRYASRLASNSGGTDPQASEMHGTATVDIGIPVRRYSPDEDDHQCAAHCGSLAFARDEGRSVRNRHVEVPPPSGTLLDDMGQESDLHGLSEAHSNSGQRAVSTFIPKGRSDVAREPRNTTHDHRETFRPLDYGEDARARDQLLHRPARTATNTPAAAANVNGIVESGVRKEILKHGGACFHRELAMDKGPMKTLQKQESWVYFEGEWVTRWHLQNRAAQYAGPRPNLFFTHSLQSTSRSRIQTAGLDPETFSAYKHVEPIYTQIEVFLSRFHAALPDRRPPVSRGLGLHVPQMLEWGLAKVVRNAKFVQKFFAVPKDEIHFRLIQNMRTLNAAMDQPPPMTLPQLHEIIGNILSSDYVAQLDAQSYFNQFAVPESIAEFFGAAAVGARGEWTLIILLVLSMGWKYAPCIAQRFSHGLCATTLRTAGRNTWSLPWVDNFFVGGGGWTDVDKTLEGFLATCAKYNVILKTANVRPQQQLEALGLKFNLITREAVLGDKFLTTLQEAMETFRIQPTPRSFYTTMGGLFWAVFATARFPLCEYPQLLQFTRSLSFSMAQKPAKWDMPLTVPPNVKAEWELAMRRVQQNWPLRLQDMEAPSSWVTLWADASSTAAGFVLEHDGADLIWGATPFPADIATMHIFVKELWTAVEALSFTRRWLDDRGLSHWAVVYAGDNEAVVKCLKKGHTRHSLGNTLLLKWYGCQSENTRTQSVWVDTETQRADPLTRGQMLPRPPMHTDIQQQFNLTKWRPQNPE